MDARSHSGMSLILGNHCVEIDVNSKKQKTVTKSMFEIPLLSFSEAENHGGDIAKLLHEIKLIAIDGFNMRQHNLSTKNIASNGKEMGDKARRFRVRH